MKHFLISGAGICQGLYKRDCDLKAAYRCIELRNKEQGTFKRKEVECKNCKRTKIFRSGKRVHF